MLNFQTESYLSSVNHNELSGGNVWFAQSNTGNLAKFDPLTESFTEFDNPLWPNTEPSMMSGIDYASDNSLWFTDDRYDSYTMIDSIKIN